MDESTGTTLDEGTRTAIREIVDQELDRLERAATDPAADPEDARLGIKLVEQTRARRESGAR